jgi:hypothetical protein
MQQHAADMDASYGPTYSYYTPWDAGMIYGCECDEGFAGFDCSLRLCPTGDDPLTTGQVNEKQVFECHKNPTDPSVVVFYVFGHPTPPLGAGAHASAIADAIEVPPAAREQARTTPVIVVCV